MGGKRRQNQFPAADRSTSDTADEPVHLAEAVLSPSHPVSGRRESGCVTVNRAVGDGAVSSLEEGRISDNNGVFS